MQTEALWRTSRGESRSLAMLYALLLALGVLAGCGAEASVTPTAISDASTPAGVTLATSAPAITLAGSAPNAIPVVNASAPTAESAATMAAVPSPEPTVSAIPTMQPSPTVTIPTPSATRASTIAPTRAPSTATSPARSSPTPVPATTLATAVATTKPRPTPIPQPNRSTETWVLTSAGLHELALDDAAFDGERVQLTRSAGGYSASAQATSPIHESAFPFDTAVVSWNADAPPGTSLKMELRVRAKAGWTGWYTMGVWSSAGGRSVAGQSDQWGKVDVDTLVLESKADALQYRATLGTSSPSVTPTLTLVAANYADLSRPLVGPKLPGDVALGRDLDVPRYSQLDQDPSVAWDVCSPTSLAMVLRYWRIDRTVPETIRGVRDASTGIYGNWPLNTAFAGAQGLVAHVDRFYSVEQLEAEIAAGRPVVISARWRAGDLDNAAVASATGGHLLVVRGFTSRGDVVVNDPAARGEGIRRVYRRAQLADVWLGQGGVVYVVRPR